jgi:hypothetical protein
LSETTVEGQASEGGASTGSRTPERRLHAVPSGPAPAASTSQSSSPSVVSFNKDELREILNVYGRMVAAGEWRDYAIDFNSQRATFSIFRRSSEMPLYRIEKDPRLARKQGVYSVITATGLILKRGHELSRVISVLDKRVKLVIT